MSQIEWQETTEITPAACSLPQFCAENGLSWDKVRDGQGLLVFVEKRALEALHAFLGHDVRREHGGVLIGRPYYDPGEARAFVFIQMAIPALDTEGSSVHLQFTGETWAFISRRIEEEFPDQMVVGWYHSHPGLGVFMSSTDRATQKAFYNHSWSIAVVVDPSARRTGWFAGKDCLPLDSASVIAFESPPSVEIAPMREPGETKAVTEIEEAKRSWLPERSWLLPAVLLMLSAAIGIWYFARNRV